MSRIQVFLSLLLFPFWSFGQLSLFNLSVLDSLQPGNFKGNTSLQLNWNRTSTNQVTLFSDLNFLFPLPEHSLEFNGNIVANTFDDRFSTGRYFTHIRADLWKYTQEGAYLEVNRFYPEMYVLQAYDRGRGLNMRLQTGVNMVYAIKRSGSWRVTSGAGVLTEYENWRIRAAGTTTPPPPVTTGTIDFLNGQNALDRNGNIRLDNIRSNVFVHFNGKVGKFNVNSFTSLQIPFSKPFDDEPAPSDVLVNNIRSPRFTLEMSATTQIVKGINLSTRISFQYDKGQPSALAPNSAFTLAQGVSYWF
ncbi:MAG: hypothetical protein LAT76_08350 [Schleiferiaceae bacterium]|nr:hypothetical protein [Schleiferiaceae bacterium]